MGSNRAGGMDVCCECCVLSGRGLCDELITRPEESYRLWYVVCDLETARMRRPCHTGVGALHRKRTNNAAHCTPAVSSFYLPLSSFYSVSGEESFHGATRKDSISSLPWPMLQFCPSLKLSSLFSSLYLLLGLLRCPWEFFTKRLFLYDTGIISQ
jgi:hypothetical protein